MMKTVSLLLLCCFIFIHTQASTLHIGPGYAFNSLEAATPSALPGDTLLIHEGTYPGGQFIYDLQGTAENWIYIKFTFSNNLW